MEDGGREFLLDVVDRFPLRGGVRRQPRTPRSGPSRCAADGQSQPCCTDTRDWQDLRGNRRCVWCGALKLAGPVLWLVNWIGDEAEGWDDVGNMFAIGVLAESHPQERSRSPSTNSKHSEDAGEQVVQLVAGDGSYSGGTTEAKKLDDLYSRDTEIVADSDVLQHSDTMLEEEGVMVANNHDEKDRDPNRVSTVEPSLRVYADKKSGAVVNPATGTSFNSLEEAYDFYKPYSWESGFGV